MKLITIEEHTLHAPVARASAPRWKEVSPHFSEAYAPETGLPYCPPVDVLEDLDEGRLADMDAHGIDMQVLSYLTTQFLPAEVAPDLVRDVNDLLAGACRRHPDRFAAFASLPTSAPDQAPAELKRAVEELGHVGAIIHGRTDDQFLSAERFDPILRTAAELDVPICYRERHDGGDPAAMTCHVGDASRDGVVDDVGEAGSHLPDALFHWRLAGPSSPPRSAPSGVLLAGPPSITPRHASPLGRHQGSQGSQPLSLELTVPRRRPLHQVLRVRRAHRL